MKQVYLNAQLARKSFFIPTFLSVFNSLFDDIESNLQSTPTGTAFNKPFQAAGFRFVCEALLGSTPSPAITSAALKYIFFQFHQNMSKLGPIPSLIEDLALHMFPFPTFIAKSNTKALYDYFSSSGAWIIDKAEKAGMSRDEACHNLIFAWISNAYLGVNAYLPRLFKWVVHAGSDLHARLAYEIRSVIAADNGEVTASGLEKMELTKSVAYEAFRFDPPVQVQFARAKTDIIIESHDAKFEVKKGEMLGGFQPMATRDPKVFDRANEFVPERFMGEGKKMLRYVYWSNGPETENVKATDKICPGKDLGVMIGRLLLVVVFQRYDTITGKVSEAMEDVTTTVTGVTKVNPASCS